MPTLKWISVLLLVYIGNASTRLVSTATPTRAGVTYINPKYISSAKVYVNRTGRKSPYYLNMVGSINYSFENNVTVDIVFYEFLHNEYKRSFVEMHFKLCDMINKDPYVGKTVAQTGITCPVPKGNFNMTKMTVPVENFPNIWPIENNKVDIIMKQTPSQDVIAKFYFIIIVKQRQDDTRKS